MILKTPEILWPALRQYRHNTDNPPDKFSYESYVNAFDHQETCKIVGVIQAELEQTRVALALATTKLSGKDYLWCREAMIKKKEDA